MQIILNMSYIRILVQIMSSTRSFDFTSEQLRLIHSFDKEGGMWIRCLPCYNYALTTKKGNNDYDMNQDYLCHMPPRPLAPQPRYV